MERVVVLVDMDCFYVQVEQRLNPSLKGKPCAVVQYKKWKGGSILAVGYEARACGVTRFMYGDDAKEKYPEIEIVRVPESRGKADLTRYREAGAEVMEVLSKFGDCVERASIDEAYLDLTQVVEARMKRLVDGRVSPGQLPNTFVTGWDKEGQEGTEEWLSTVFDSEDLSYADRQLAVAAVIAEEMRAAVLEETGFHCSAGISHNKVLSKLACGLHKPNKQTVLSMQSVPGLFQTLPVHKIRRLGGKLGKQLVEQLGVEFIGDLVKFPKSELVEHFGEKTGPWLYQMCRGVEHEPVSARQLAKSIGCSKNFLGKDSLDTREKVKHWIGQMAAEVVERLIKDRADTKRIALSATVSVRHMNSPSYASSTRACPLPRYDAENLAADAFGQLQRFNTAPPHQAHWSPPILTLGLSASKFVEEGGTRGQDISALFSTQAAASQRPSTSTPHPQTASLSAAEDVCWESSTQGMDGMKSPTKSKPNQISPVKHGQSKKKASVKSTITSFLSQATSSVSGAQNLPEKDLILIDEGLESRDSPTKSNKKSRDIASYFSKPTPSGAALHGDTADVEIVGEDRRKKQVKKGSIESFFHSLHSSSVVPVLPP